MPPSDNCPRIVLSFAGGVVFACFADFGDVGQLKYDMQAIVGSIRVNLSSGLMVATDGMPALYVYMYSEPVSWAES